MQLKGKYHDRTQTTLRYQKQTKRIQYCIVTYSVLFLFRHLPIQLDILNCQAILWQAQTPTTNVVSNKKKEDTRNGLRDRRYRCNDHDSILMQNSLCCFTGWRKHTESYKTGRGLILTWSIVISGFHESFVEIHSYESSVMSESNLKSNLQRFTNLQKFMNF